MHDRCPSNTRESPIWRPSYLPLHVMPRPSRRQTPPGGDAPTPTRWFANVASTNEDQCFDSSVNGASMIVSEPSMPREQQAGAPHQAKTIVRAASARPHAVAARRPRTGGTIVP
jgi:hypothetical protein